MGQTSIVVILLLSRGLSGSALVVAAAEKLASPGRASRALTQLAELALPRGSQVSPSAVRVAACCEAGVAVYGVSRPLEPTAGIPLLVVGCVFLSLECSVAWRVLPSRAAVLVTRTRPPSAWSA